MQNINRHQSTDWKFEIENYESARMYKHEKIENENILISNYLQNINHHQGRDWKFEIEKLWECQNVLTWENWKWKYLNFKLFAEHLP